MSAFRGLSALSSLCKMVQRAHLVAGAPRELHLFLHQLRFLSNLGYFSSLYLASGKITLSIFKEYCEEEVRFPLECIVVCYSMV